MPIDKYDRKFNQNARRQRQLRKLSQDELAGKLKVKRSRLGAWEENRSAPPTTIKFLICDLFGTDFKKMHEE